MSCKNGDNNFVVQLLIIHELARIGIFGAHEHGEQIIMQTFSAALMNDFHDELIDDVNELPTKRVKKLFHIIKDKRWEKYQGGKKKYQKGWKKSKKIQK